MELEKFVAVPNRKAQLTGTELEELTREAEDHPGINSVVRGKSNVTFRATAEAVGELKRALGDRVIIEADKPLFPL